MRGVFISYRQDDAKPWALLLRQDLVQAFGEECVFLDKDTLHAGNWREQIDEALDSSGVALVVIGRRWLTSADDRGQRRLDAPGDVHRQEIASALSRKDVTVIPVVVDGASVPSAESLPPDIRTLSDQQAREISDNNARRQLDLRALIADIERATGMTARGSEPRLRTRLKIAAAVAVGLGVAILALLATLNRGIWRPSSQGRSDATANANVEADNRQLFKAIDPAAVRIESDGGFVGSGLFVSGSGVVLTTAYLAERLNKQNIQVKLSTGSRVRARLVKIAQAEDLALLETDIVEKVVPLGLASGAVSQGDGVLAVVQSPDEEWLGVTGKVTRVGVATPMGEGRIEVDIAESIGRLGSPVMNTRGELIGLIQGSYKDRPGYAFLVPVSTIRSLLAK